MVGGGQSRSGEKEVFEGGMEAKNLAYAIYVG
jgi:hypothetical protein